MDNRGQSFIEFLLVFIILFAITNGLFLKYKSALKSRYATTTSPAISINYVK